MDNHKLHSKNESYVSSFVDMLNMFSADIRMKFGLEKCGVFVLNRGKIKCMDGWISNAIRGSYQANRRGGF